VLSNSIARLEEMNEKLVLKMKKHPNFLIDKDIKQSYKNSSGHSSSSRQKRVIHDDHKI